MVGGGEIRQYCLFLNIDFLFIDAIQTINQKKNLILFSARGRTNVYSIPKYFKITEYISSNPHLLQCLSSFPARIQHQLQYSYRLSQERQKRRLPIVSP
jgi:hypothetical protein